MSLRMRSPLPSLGLLALVSLSMLPLAVADSADPMASGEVELRSVGALAFGPENVLFVGDSEGGAVYAMEVEAGASPGATLRIADVDAKIAALLGTTAREIYVKDMAVHPSGSVFLSVMRGAGEGAVPVIVRIDGEDRIEALDLSDRRHARLKLANAPAEDAVMYRRRARSLTITDLEFIDGELFIAGLSNEEFASTLRRAPYPFTGEVATTGLEIYHGAHGEWETFAPIFSFTRYEVDGEPYLLAGYLCTPLVTFPLEELRGKERIRGKTIAELGWGNTPTDIVAGKSFVLVANNRRGTMRIEAAEIAAAQKRDGITTKAEPRTGVDYHTVPLGNVAQMAALDADNLIVLARSMENGALYLRGFPIGRG